MIPVYDASAVKDPDEEVERSLRFNDSRYKLRLWAALLRAYNQHAFLVPIPNYFRRPLTLEEQRARALVRWN